jgi:hypothetical protein
MQIIPLIFSGFWIMSSSILPNEIQNMRTGYTHIPIERASDQAPLASVPSPDIPIYHSPYPILSATGKVILDTRKYDKKIYRYGKKSDPITYAWEQWKDIDFILMIQEESLWDELIS